MPALSEIHESPLTMLVPLAVLAAGAVFAGFIFHGDFIGEKSAEFWHGAIAAIAGNGLKPMPEAIPLWVELSPFVMTLFGFAVAFYYYILHPELPPQLAAKQGLLYTFLYNKWYFDELYDFLFVRPALSLAASCGSSVTGRSSTDLVLMALRPACSTPRAARSSSSPDMSTTTPSRC